MNGLTCRTGFGVSGPSSALDSEKGAWRQWLRVDATRICRSSASAARASDAAMACRWRWPRRAAQHSSCWRAPATSYQPWPVGDPPQEGVDVGGEGGCWPLRQPQRGPSVEAVNAGQFRAVCRPESAGSAAIAHSGEIDHPFRRETDQRFRRKPITCRSGATRAWFTAPSGRAGLTVGAAFAWSLLSVRGDRRCARGGRGWRRRRSGRR